MRPVASSPDDTVAQILRLLHTRPATLGPGRLLCIDGPAGSGKTTLASAVATAAGAPVLHVDDLLEGWSGLETVHEPLGRVLVALAAGRPARWRRWDWQADARAEEHTLAPAPLVVVEGVGSAQRAWAQLTTVLAWVEAPPDVRLRRGLARDGDALREHWQRWTRDEAALFAREGTRDRADVVVVTAETEEEHR